MKENDTRRIGFEDLKGFCKKVYIKAGVPEEEAQIVAGLLARSDLRGVETHGVILLPTYIKRIQNGYVRKQSKLTLLREKGSMAFIAANGSMGHVVAYKAMKMAIEKAERYGIGWVSVKDSGHFGVAGLFTMMALEKDFIGYVTTNTTNLLAPYGGSERILGNNPISYAFPAGRFPPVIVDISCSVVSAGRLVLYRKRGEKIPIGWALDKKGLPTQDPYEGFEGGGSLAPLGGHKGYSLILANEILTAILTGGKKSKNIRNIYEEEKSGIQGTCHSFMALDTDFFIGRDEFKKSMDHYIKSIKESAKAKGVKEILLPGERGHRIEAERLKVGIPLSANTAMDLMALGKFYDISIPFLN